MSPSKVRPAAGVATTMVAGLLAMATIGPQMAPVVSSPVGLLATANPLQPEIN